MKFLRLTLYLAYASLIFSSCNDKTPPHEKLAVDTVWDEFQAAEKGLANSLESDSHTLRLKNLEGIDVSECPEDFQKAWDEYLVALKHKGPDTVIYGLDVDSPQVKKVKEFGAARAKLWKTFEQYSIKAEAFFEEVSKNTAK